jgi:predicted secreted protein
MATIVVDDIEQLQHEVQLVDSNELVKLTLPSNGVGGYEWLLRTVEGEVLVRSIENGEYPYANSDLPIEEIPIGGGIDRVFEFFVLSATARIAMERHRAWMVGKEAPIRALAFDITVADTAPKAKVETRDPFDVIPS